MGIPKVTGFMKHNYNWKRKNFSKSKIVIDGYSLCHRLYSENHGWQLGGEYREFYQTVTSYFNGLREIEIDPYIVIDGVDHENKKSSTHIDRCEQKIELIASIKFDGSTDGSILPLFAKMVFVDAVSDLGLKFFVANGEADQEVVALANYLGCPILSLDSDYYIFNVEGGYIPVIDPVDGGNMVDLKREVRFFSYRDFDAQFFDSRDLRLFFPFILGNDFLEGFSMSRLGFAHSTAVHMILPTVKRHFSGDYRADEDILRRQGENVVERMEHVRRFYRVGPRSLKDLSTSRYLCRVSSHIPQWVVELFKKGQFLHTMMKLLAFQNSKTWCYTNVIEDVKQPSAWDVSRILRQYIISLLFHGVESQTPHVYETVRRVSRPGARRRYCLAHERVDFQSREAILSDLASLPSQPLEARRNIFLRVLQCDDVSGLFEAIPEELKLVVIASRFWFKTARKVSQLEKTLVFCILSCSGSINMPELDTRRSYETTLERRLAIVHALAQWQCVLHDAIALNQVLCQPFTYTSPAKLFSAVHVENILASGMQPPRTKLFDEIIVAISS